MLLPTNAKTLLELLTRGKVEFLAMKATAKKDEFELLVRVKP